MSDVEVTTTGPIFDGSAPMILDRLDAELTEATAQVGVLEVQAALADVLVDPTGYYSSQIQVERRVDNFAVTDGGVVYGPWLAGVSSRNQTSRFKGYAHWRRAAQRTEAKVDAIAAPIVDLRTREMNG